MLRFASPLLAIAGFYDPPFRVRAEQAVQLQLEDHEETLQDRIDVLVLSEQLWVIILESKKTALSVWSALPQALAYLMANPQAQWPRFGLITNGDSLVFIKLSDEVDGLKYDFSRVFATLTSQQELNLVLQVLQKIGQMIGSSN